MKTFWKNGHENYRFGTRDDIEPITEMLSDPEVGRYLWFTPLPTAGVEAYFGPLFDAQKEALDRSEYPTNAVFSVVDEQDHFLGQGAAVEVMGSPGGFEIGFQLTRSAWGRGVGTRLARFLCAWAVHVHDAYRIEGDCFEHNTGSKRLLEKVGLELEGTRIDYRLKGEVRHNELCFGARVSDLDTGAIRSLAEEMGFLAD